MFRIWFCNIYYLVLHLEIERKQIESEKMKNFIKKYNDLENEVVAELRKEIAKSKFPCRFIDNCKAIKLDYLNVSIFNYVEIVSHDTKLIFLDEDGLHYDLLAASVSLEELIDILIVLQEHRRQFTRAARAKTFN